MMRSFLAVLFASALSPALIAQPYKLLPVYNEAEYNAGTPPGDNQQYMTAFTYSESDPDRIYSAHDVGGAWERNQWITGRIYLWRPVHSNGGLLRRLYGASWQFSSTAETSFTSMMPRSWLQLL